MGYSTDILNRRVKIMARTGGGQTELGKSSGEWAEVGTVWAGVTWTRGAKALREGALDAYDTVMVRMRWRGDVNRDVRIVDGGKVYEVDTMQGDRQQNVVQLVCHEVQE